MKSAAQLAQKLSRQWENSDLRESRLLDEADAWPICLSIGKPTATALRDQTGDVKKHFDLWRKVKIGQVVWKSANYQATNEKVEYPDQWILPNADAWVSACENKEISKQYSSFRQILALSDSAFHSLLIRRRALWVQCDPDEIKRILNAAQQLYPECADGLPLRALPIAGNDTKFFERNEYLLKALLDVRFDGEASRQGLETFLGAHSNRGHWLLLVDLDGSLLPFRQMRINATELCDKGLPGGRLLVVENETCQHQLRQLQDTIALLGTG
ncbi:MAG: DUF3322 domain-containing protein, partial [Verrucomicrobiota bacterium]